MICQRWLRIIPVALIMYTIAYIDRTNASLALLAIRHDLRIMNAAQALNAAGVFFWGYLLLQIPGGHLAHRWSAKEVVGVLLIFSGFFAACGGFVHSWRAFWFMRLMLGVSEGGVFPATLVLLSNWFPRTERARANAYWMLCQPLALVVASLLSGWILGQWDWRVLLIAEGALPFLRPLVWNAFVDDHPGRATWISREEREYLETTFKREVGQTHTLRRGASAEVIRYPEGFLMMVTYFLLSSGGYGFLFWQPPPVQVSKS
jgi:MFS family permease